MMLEAGEYDRSSILHSMVRDHFQQRIVRAAAGLLFLPCVFLLSFPVARDEWKRKQEDERQQEQQASSSTNDAWAEK
jgi:hypothetical protein